MFVLEGGINHFGRISEANILLKFFLKSNFNKISFMIHTNLFYSTNKKKGLNFELPYKFYKDSIDKVHKKKKKIGLSVCDIESFNKYKDLNFDFYKLLSVAINNYELINCLKKKKNIYVSTGFANHKKIKNCLKAFGNSKFTLLHTPMSYNEKDLCFKKIYSLKKKYNKKVGYSHHHNNNNAIYALSAYKPDEIFLYVRQKDKINRIYPDHDHAIKINDLESLRINYLKCEKMHLVNKKYKVNIFNNEIKI
jgi:sialic acid synthase SpsE